VIGLTNHHKYFLYEGVCDMRKGFNGLSGIVTTLMLRSPTDGCVYLFINRRRDRMKMLVWESGGYMLYYKRLEQGRFELPQNSATGKLQITWETLVLLLTGISLHQIKRKKRYKLVPQN